MIQLEKLISKFFLAIYFASLFLSPQAAYSWSCLPVERYVVQCLNGKCDRGFHLRYKAFGSGCAGNTLPDDLPLLKMSFPNGSLKQGPTADGVYEISTHRFADSKSAAQIECWTSSSPSNVALSPICLEQAISVRAIDYPSTVDLNVVLSDFVRKSTILKWVEISAPYLVALALIFGLLNFRKRAPHVITVGMFIISILGLAVFFSEAWMTTAAIGFYLFGAILISRLALALRKSLSTLSLIAIGILGWPMILVICYFAWTEFADLIKN